MRGRGDMDWLRRVDRGEADFLLSHPSRKECAPSAGFSAPNVRIAGHPPGTAHCRICLPYKDLSETMDNFKLRHRFALSLWLPVFAVVLSAAIVLVPSARVYLRWKAAMGSGDKLMLSAGNFQMIINREHLLRSAVEPNAMREQGTI